MRRPFDDADAFRCLGCETPTRGGRLCAACRDDDRVIDIDDRDDATYWAEEDR
jgi:hypothetical protein